MQAGFANNVFIDLNEPAFSSFRWGWTIFRTFIECGSNEYF